MIHSNTQIMKNNNKMRHNAYARKRIFLKKCSYGRQVIFWYEQQNGLIIFQCPTNIFVVDVI